MFEKFLFAVSHRLLSASFRFRKWVHSIYGMPWVGVVDISFEDPFGNDFLDPLHNSMEYDWNKEFLGFLWDSGYKVDVSKINTVEEARMQYGAIVDAWLLDCYRNALFEDSQKDNFVKEAPTDPGFTRRTRRYRRWEGEVSDQNMDGHMQDYRSFGRGDNNAEVTELGANGSGS